MTAMQTEPKVVTRNEWLKARLTHLEAEKEFTRQRDELSRQRRELPLERVETDYVFEGPDGPCAFGDLFEGRRQLIVYHFMFDPAWEEGCKSCSFLADNFAGSLAHLAARDTSFAVISRAPLAKIERFRKRMGWDFPWLSSSGCEFNYHFQVTIDQAHAEYNYRPVKNSAPRELPGLSVFLRAGEQIFHTYSTYARGLDIFLNTYNFLDHTPLGRQENGNIMAWVRHHDKYAVEANGAGGA